MLLFPFVLMIQSFLNAALFLSRASDARSLARRRRSHVLKVSAAVVLKRQNY